MNLDRISIFIEVVRRGSLASVARDRNVDPSSISRAIASLEKTLGLRLLQRTTRKLAPTEAGLAYLLRVEPLLEELAHARESVSDDSHQLKGVIRILSPVSFGLLNLVPLIPSLAAQHPHLEFDLVLTDARVDLIAERIDLALRLGPMRDSNFIAQKLAPLVGKHRRQSCPPCQTWSTVHTGKSCESQLSRTRLPRIRFAMDTHVEEEKEGVDTSRWEPTKFKRNRTQTLRSSRDGRDPPSHLDHRRGTPGEVVGRFVSRLSSYGCRLSGRCDMGYVPVPQIPSSEGSYPYSMPSK